MLSSHFWVSLQCRKKQGDDGHTVTHVRALCRAIHSGPKTCHLLLPLLAAWSATQFG